MLAHDRYTYREEDAEHVGLCAEFSSLSWLDQTPEDALKGIRQVVSDVVKDLIESGEGVPEPLSTRKFSGKFQVRVTSDTHRALAIKAAEKHVSLNRLVSESRLLLAERYLRTNRSPVRAKTFEFVSYQKNSDLLCFAASAPACFKLSLSASRYLCE